MQRIIPLVFTFILLCALPLFGQGKEGSVQIPEVKTVQAAKKPLHETVSTSGTTKAISHSKLSFQVSGTVSEIMVETGDTIKEGQALARLDDTVYKLQVEQANASCEAAKANLAKLEAGFRPEEISQARAAVEAAKAGYEQSKRDYERMEKLASEKKAVADAACEQSRMAMELAKSRYDQSLKQLEFLEKGFQEEDIKAASAQVAVAEAALKMSKKYLEDTVLRAPYDAIVVRKFIDQGDSVGVMPGGAIEIMNITRLELSVPIPDKWTNHIKTGSLAIVDLDGGPKNIKIKVRSISCAIDPTSRAFDIKLIINNSDLKLKAGMFARVRVIYSTREALAVPSSAVMEDAQLRYVFLHKDGKAIRKYVKTGIDSEGFTEITGGLTEEDIVIYEGNFGLSQGTTVKIKKEENK